MLTCFQDCPLHLLEFSIPTTLADKQVVISQPTYDWEIYGPRVNEGPAVLVRTDKVFLTFSASATGANYHTGLLYFDKDADLLDPDSWHKLPVPDFYSNEDHNRFGPGHNSFTKIK